jgi:hypothetical protein
MGDIGRLGREHAMVAFPHILRKFLHIGTSEERRQHRLDRNALDSRIKAEYLDTYTRDVNGLGRVDPDRRRP